MTTRRELGTITRSEGAITCLEFFGTSHLFCGTERGDVLVWKTNHWEQMPSLKGHTGRVNGVSVHPSGVLALTTSQDKTLKLWDLEKGVVAHTNKLEQEAEHVKWSPDGNHYIVVSDKRIVLYSSHGKKLRSMAESKRIISVVWINNSRFATGGEDRKLFVWDIHSDDPVLTFTRFFNRIKGIAIMPKVGKSTDQEEMPYIVTISSDERLRIWDPNQSTDTPVCSVYQDIRFICLCVAPVPNTSEKKKKNKQRRDAEEDEEVQDEEDGEVVGGSAKKSKKHEVGTTAQQAEKRFKVIEFEEHKPIRRPGPSSNPSSPAASSSKPLKSILKKREPLPEMDVDDSPSPAPVSAPISRKPSAKSSKPQFSKSVTRDVKSKIAAKKRSLASLFE